MNPPNVLISRVGEVKLADFGIAIAGGARDSSGKPEYLAPEQVQRRDHDERADLYALGLTLHETLTGSRVFYGSVTLAAAASVALPSASRPDVPQPLDRLVMRLLELEPSRRPSSASEVRAALAPFVSTHARQRLSESVRALGSRDEIAERPTAIKSDRTVRSPSAQQG